jgi:hypothetical protein
LITLETVPIATCACAATSRIETLARGPGSGLLLAAREAAPAAVLTPDRVGLLLMNPLEAIIGASREDIAPPAATRSILSIPLTPTT